MRFPMLVFFARALREQTRSVITYVLRAFFVCILLFSLLVAYLTQFTTNAPGLIFLTGILFTNLIISSFLGLVYFATAITEEKEEMTLGLLQMSGLNPVSILLGKSTSRLFAVVLLLLVQVPLAVLAVTLGGVSLLQVWAAYLTTVAYIFFLCNLGLLFSVLSSGGRRATARTALSLFIFLIIPKPCLGLIALLVDAGHLADEGLIHTFVGGFCISLMKTSPFTQMVFILSTGFSSSPISYQVVASVMWGILFFVVSWVVFDSRTREQKVAAPDRGIPTRERKVLRRFGAGRTWLRALVWKDFHFLAGGKARLTAKTLSFALVLVGCGIAYYAISIRIEGRTPPFGELKRTAAWCVLVTVGIVTLFEAGVFASRFLGQEIKWKTLSSTVLLPMSMSRLVGMKSLGVFINFLPNIAFLLIGCCLVPDTIADVMSTGFSNPEIVAGALYVVVCYAFFIYLTTLLSLYTKWGAFALAFVISLFMQYFIFCAISMLVVIFKITTGSMNLEIIFLILGVITAALCVASHRCILVRLEKVAGQAA